MRIDNAPCKECKERHLGCHDNCEKYKDWSNNRPNLKAIKEEVGWTHTTYMNKDEFNHHVELANRQKRKRFK